MSMITVSLSPTGAQSQRLRSRPGEPSLLRYVFLGAAFDMSHRPEAFTPTGSRGGFRTSSPHLRRPLPHHASTDRYRFTLSRDVPKVDLAQRLAGSRQLLQRLRATQRA
jgi:hypothetical protein